MVERRLKAYDFQLTEDMLSQELDRLGLGNDSLYLQRESCIKQGLEGEKQELDPRENLVMFKLAKVLGSVIPYAELFGDIKGSTRRNIIRKLRIKIDPDSKISSSILVTQAGIGLKLSNPKTEEIFRQRLDNTITTHTTRMLYSLNRRREA